jgi:hypothetical protein
VILADFLGLSKNFGGLLLFDLKFVGLGDVFCRTIVDIKALGCFLNCAALFPEDNLN